MPVIVERSGSTPYTTGSAYSVGTLVDFHGVNYRVVADIPAPAPAIPDYSTLRALGLGAGAASYKVIDTGLGGDIWVHIASFADYFAGDFSVGGIFNGHQMSFGGRVTTTYNSSTVSGSWSTYSGASAKEIRFLQPAVGDPLELWVRVVNNTSNWAQEFVSIGAGTGVTTVPALAKSQLADPGTGFKAYSFLTGGSKGGQFSSLAPVLPGAAFTTCIHRTSADVVLGSLQPFYYNAPEWTNTTSDGSILTIGAERITVNRAGSVNISFEGVSMDNRRIGFMLNGANAGYQEIDPPPTGNFARATEAFQVVKDDYLQVYNPGTGFSSWKRMAVQVNWVGK